MVYICPQSQFVCEQRDHRLFFRVVLILGVSTCWVWGRRFLSETLGRVAMELVSLKHQQLQVYRPGLYPLFLSLYARRHETRTRGTEFSICASLSLSVSLRYSPRADPSMSMTVIPNNLPALQNSCLSKVISLDFLSSVKSRVRNIAGRVT